MTSTVEVSLSARATAAVAGPAGAVGDQTPPMAARPDRAAPADAASIPAAGALAAGAATAVARVDWWVLGVVAANIAQVAGFAWVYPHHRLDPDLLAYLTYFRNWLADDRTLHGIAYFTAPKTLLVFTLGALGSASNALVFTALASALLGTAVYLIARDAFGRAAALAASFLLLLDPSKAILTLKSSADLYLALFVLLAILLADRGRLLGASMCLLLSALVKPVTLPCAACFLVAPGTRMRRWSAALIPLLAVPLMLLAHRALLGGAFEGSRFFDEFASMTGGEPIGPGEVFHYAIWSQLIRIRFASTASWGILGLLLWVSDDRTRLTRALLLMPLLFVLGYVGLSAVAPYPPYFRYFWLLEVWFLMFLAYGALDGARRLAPEAPRLRQAVAGVVLVLLADGMIGRQLDYRRDYAEPLEQSMSFADGATGLLKARWQTGDTVVAPLGLLPYMMWEMPDAGRAGGVDTAERIARERATPQPDWILDVPRMYATDATRQWMGDLVRNGSYEVLVTDGQAALLGRAGDRPALAVSGR